MRSRVIGAIITATRVFVLAIHIALGRCTILQHCIECPIKTQCPLYALFNRSVQSVDSTPRKEPTRPTEDTATPTTTCTDEVV